jgi:hypothetical protein
MVSLIPPRANDRRQGCGISIRPRQESCGRMPQTAHGLSCMFPEDSLFQDCQFDYTAHPRVEVAKTVIWDAGKSRRDRSRRADRCPVSLRIPQNLAKSFPWLEQARALACHVLCQVQPRGRRVVPIDPPHSLRFLRDGHPDLYRAGKRLRAGRVHQGGRWVEPTPTLPSHSRIPDRSDR